MTRTEWTLHHYIAQCPEPFLFYPQVPFGRRLTLDFFCPNAMLCVEVDGAEHYTGEHVLSDERRDAYLKSCGVATYRITNTEVNTDPRRAAEKVFKRVCKRRKIYVHTNPASPFYGWSPRPPLTP